MERLLEEALLFDFYGELLTEYQRSIYEDFAMGDLSLAEIAQDEGVSRQAVHDIVKRCRKKLSSYEERLHLVEKFLKIQKLAARIDEEAERLEEAGTDAAVIRKLAAEITDQL